MPWVPPRKHRLRKSSDAIRDAHAPALEALNANLFACCCFVEVTSSGQP